MSGRILNLGDLSLPDTDLPLHERLADAIETAILRGNIRPGQRLPTHREISRSFDVAIGTVTKAIDSLSRRGIVRGEIGRGTFVQDAKPSRESRVIDMSVNGPSQVVKPEVMAAAAERAARYVAALPNGGYASLTGPVDQRATLAGWLCRSRLEDVCADDLILCVGAQHGIFLCLADLAELSPAVATEGATFNGAMTAAASLGMKVLPVAYRQHQACSAHEGRAPPV